MKKENQCNQKKKNYRTHTHTHTHSNTHTLTHTLTLTRHSSHYTLFFSSFPLHSSSFFIITTHSLYTVISPLLPHCPFFSLLINQLNKPSFQHHRLHTQGFTIHHFFTRGSEASSPSAGGRQTHDKGREGKGGKGIQSLLSHH